MNKKYKNKILKEILLKAKKFDLRNTEKKTQQKDLALAENLLNQI